MGRSPVRSPLSQRNLELAEIDSLPVVRIRSGVPATLVFRKQIADADPKAVPGDIVAVKSAGGDRVGFALFNPRSEIVLRMLSGQDEPPIASLWQSRFDWAVGLRRNQLCLDDVTDAYRIIHAEGDGMSGLVADRFGDVLSIEAFSLAMYLRAEAIAQMLGPIIGTSHWIARPGPKMVGQEGLEAAILPSDQCPNSVVVKEFDTRFRIRFEGGHKTGFFCDQRDNRRQLAQFCKDKRVLDLCCYTGGFAVQAKRLGEAADVTGVDLDAAPLEMARENANLNQLRIKFVQADAFSYMRDMIRGGQRYDVVVLDPPKLIGSRQEYAEGKRTHFDLNRLAFELVEPGGLLLTCCCAGLLSEEEFFRLVLSAARQAGGADAALPQGRRVQVLARTGAGMDHPVADNYLQSEYLKAIWLRVH